MMHGPPVELNYKHDRRAHRHRCRCCRKIVNAGEAVIMAKVADRKTWVIHTACGDRRHSDSYTWREVMAVWAAEHKSKF